MQVSALFISKINYGMYISLFCGAVVLLLIGLFAKRDRFFYISLLILFSSIGLGMFYNYQTNTTEVFEHSTTDQGVTYKISQTIQKDQCPLNSIFGDTKNKVSSSASIQTQTCLQSKIKGWLQSRHGDRGFSNFFFTASITLLLYFTLLLKYRTAYNNDYIRRNEALFLVIVCAIGSCLLLEVTNLLQIYILIEILNISLYGVLLSTKGGNNTTTATLRYLLQNIIIASLMLFGMFLLYLSTSSLRLSALTTFSARIVDDKQQAIYSNNAVNYDIKGFELPYSLQRSVAHKSLYNHTNINDFLAQKQKVGNSQKQDRSTNIKNQNVLNKDIGINQLNQDTTKQRKSNELALVSYTPQKAQVQIFVCGVILFIAGLLFKLGCAPFHFWMPEVYAQTPLYAVQVLSTLPKIAFFGLLCFFLSLIPMHNDAIMRICAVLSMLIGAIGMLRQRSVMRIFAYSGVFNLGVMLCLEVEAIQTIGMTYMLSYTLLSIAPMFLLFSYFDSAIAHSPSKKMQQNEENNALSTNESDGPEQSQIGEMSIQLLAGMGRKYPLLGFAITLAVFTIAGIPPMHMFWNKIILINALFEAHNREVLAWVAIVLSVVVCYRYLAIIVALYFQPEKQSKQKEQHSDYFAVSGKSDSLADKAITSTNNEVVSHDISSCTALVFSGKPSFLISISSIAIHLLGAAFFSYLFYLLS